MTDQVTKEDLDEVKAAVKENTRALRGSNGTPGVVADIVTVKHDVREIKENHLVHLEENLKAEMLLLETRLLAEIQKMFSERSRSTMHDWVRPILIPVILGMLTVILTLWASGTLQPVP